MYSIGDLSRLTGVKIPTIRYYEQVGLLQSSARTAGNQRRYTDQGLERLSFIRHARELGLTIDDIRELSELSNHPDRPCAEAHQIAERHLEMVSGRIKKLKRLEKELKRIAAISDVGRVGNCHVIRALADHRFCSDDH